MRLLVVAAFAIVTGAFAGCIGGVGTISAMDGLEPATDAAKALAGETPQLLAVSSIEPLSKYLDEEDDLEINVYLDKTPGDGLAPGWIYTFAAGDDLIIIGFASGLGVLFDARDGGELADEDVSEYVISGWKADSDDAAAALNAHEQWPDMTPSSLVFWELMQGDECPMWQVEHMDAQDEGDVTFAQVDGCTGEVTAIATENMFGFSCGSSYTSGSGTILPLFDDERNLDAEEGSYVAFVVTFEVGTDQNSWTLSGPDGIVAQGDTSTSQRYDDMAAGTYTLTISSGVGATTYSASLETSTC